MDKLKQQWQDAPIWQKILVVLSFSLIVAYGIYMSYISPISDKISEIENQNQELKDQLNLLKKLTNNKEAILLNKKLKDLKLKLAQDKLKLEEFYKNVPDKPKVEEVIDFISKKSEENNIILLYSSIEKEEESYLSYDENTKSLTITPKEPPKDDKTPKEKQTKEDKKKKENENSVPIKVVYMKVDLKANSYKSINNFLESLSKSDRLITVRNVNLKKENNYINTNLTLNIYYIPQEGKDAKEKK